MNKTTVIVWWLWVLVAGLTYVMWWVMWDVEPIPQEVSTGSVATWEVELQKIRLEMALNDITIMNYKKIKEQAEKDALHASDEIEKARQENRELEQQRVQIINWAEQLIIYQTTGEAASWLLPTTE